MKKSNMPDKKFKETAIRMINKFESGTEDSDFIKDKNVIQNQFDENTTTEAEDYNN